ncbi:DUF3556 domain-containing protein [Nocardia farcinica]|uniref:DUF3556 domain-containing protein n=1 Tax=Nocardia farcinica TaxID=37329 RepID=UPI001895522A|nr:DUF3556 domain-containing protein [Nocardia farcinica]MBF6383667.1 DUF3556 domain-containing protein [Nocardia farcinica]MBF6417863.1 DUF3556 domain-containing protein [Nocardia farcinica]MBF6429340.1 DUF3556 domain-containing protein [Nocardia farcinica]MBF6499924.1 DUF3556 domain-containing protein [Nocardia farcinica]MBF6537269.1 DUF3556 domain-containing protein [Nocardia farcinica]
MGFKTGDFPPVDVDTFLDRPLAERMKTLALHWAEYGFGSPRMIHTVYIVKLLVLYALGGVVVATVTSGVGPFWAVGGWWNEPIVYQKLVLWTVLLEAVGVAGSWGPLAGKFKPMTGGILFWARPGTIRLRPWRWMPGTAGDTRTIGDVVLYVAFLAGLLVAILAPGAPSASLSAALPDNTSGLIDPRLLIAPIVLYVLCGLRDKTIFLAARGEQYLPALLFFATLPFVDMIIAAKLLICAVWIGAGVSKFGRHFANVVPPMVSNSPSIPSKWAKRLNYRDFPRDLRPSRVAAFLAHVGGTTVEIITPLVLLFSTNHALTLAGVVLMVVFHFFITSTFPLAVPLEWNILFAYLTVFLFLGFPVTAGYGVGDMSSPWLTLGIVAALAFFPVLGNLRPDLVSFLPSMRQYAGNWASALWAFAPGAEAKLNTLPHRPTVNQLEQLRAMGYDPAVAEITLQQTIAWRSMHSQGRGLFSVLYRHIPDLDRWTVREAEFGCNSIIGFNFGDGHLHDHTFVQAVQSRVGFEPGEWIIVWVESQPIHRGVQRYQVIDAALGVIERGSWRVADAVDAQPWLPDGPIPTEVSWRRDDAERTVPQPDRTPTPQPAR